MEKGNYYEKQKKLAFAAFLLEVPNFIAIAVFFILTGNIILLVDLLNSMSVTAKELFVSVISRKLNRDLKYEYNFGTTKIEALASLCCDVVLLCGLAVAAGIGVWEIVRPVAVSGLLIYAVLLKVLNVAIDTVFFVIQGRLNRAANTSLTAAEYANYKKDLVFDAGVLLSTLACALLARFPFSVYISPALSILISIVFSFTVVRRIRGYIGEVTEKTLDEKHQLTLCRMCAKHFAEYEDLNAVRSKIMGNILYVEFDLAFDADTPYRAISELREKLQNELTQEFGSCSVSITISRK